MPKYYQDIKNPLTGEVLRITSNDHFTLQNKVDKKLQVWSDQNQKLLVKQAKEENIANARQQTEDTLDEINEYKNILKYTLKIDDKIDWEKLYNKKKYNKLKPELNDFLVSDPLKNLFSFIPMVKESIDKQATNAKKKYRDAVEQYESEESAFYKSQSNFNDSITKTKDGYEKIETKGVNDYFNLVLERSKYPDSLNLNYEINYEPQAKILLLDVDLPHKNDFPRIIEYKYSPSKDEIVTKEMKEKEFEEFYNDALFQITLRTIHEICESDYVKSAGLIVFNGWVEGVDSKTGKDFRNCIISLQVKPEEFNELSLSKIDPKDCFKHLKGVSAGSLINLAPVKPIMKLDTNDNRFIQADNILDGFDSNSNLAVMPWEEFEVLVRDLFAKEFSTNTCKVEVTRASRDAGVDAIAFDEDPIRGGKFVIQAKRYNNLVPVSAVRDLYGTVMNEGAVKGILVTTSYFGPDALEFVKNKPLTLINGEQLLYMFNKHGYNLKIEIQKKQGAMSYNNY